MQLTDEQKTAVKQWAAEGCTLTDIQNRLRETFQVALSFLDIRFLVLDLGIRIKDRAAPAASVNLAKPGARPGPEPDAADADEVLAPDAAGGGVSVTLDRIVKPGAVVSGTVRFSDGVQASWMLDQMGRLALDAGKRKYRPSPEDVQAFQDELRTLLQSRGY